jgi:ABC-type Mn2+/Zn2+ transport system permease subunit
MLGVAVAGFFEQEPTVISIVFTLAGAFLMSFIKVQDRRIKLESIIGIIYAVASAATVLFISKSPHGDSDISEVLFGSVFTVTDSQIWTMLIVFGLLGAIHFVFRNRFFSLTEKFEKHDVDDIGVFDLWNVLFYISIGLAIVLAVRSAGVIPVFSYLIIPPVAAMLAVQSRFAVVLFALLISVLANISGLYVSLYFDFPAGSSIVALLGVWIVVAALFRQGKKLGGFQPGEPLKDRETEQVAALSDQKSV